MTGSLNPLGPICGAYCLDNSEIAVIMGPVGSAKTTGSMLRLARHAWEQQPWPGKIRGKDVLVRYSRWAIVRNTGPQLVDTTMKSWFKLFPTDNKWRRWTSTTKTALWEFPTGKDPLTGKEIWMRAEFMFRALDDEEDVANLLSLEVTGIYFNEFREIDTTIFANARARYGRYPGADMGGCTWQGAIGDTNPWAFTSDFHDMFVVDKRPGFKFFHQPGGLDPLAENLENLNQTRESITWPIDDPRRRALGRIYYERLLSTYKKHDADVYVHSKYGVSRAGKPVFPSYDDNVHCRLFELQQVNPPAGGQMRKNVRWVKRTPEMWDQTIHWTKLEKVTPIRIGYDNTGRNPAASVAQRAHTGQWCLRYEFVGEGMGLRAHAEALAAFLAEKIPNYQIERITCDPAGRAKGADDLDMRMVVSRQFPGVSVVNARTNDIETRIDAGENVFRRLVNGEPAILIHPECRTLRAALTHKYKFRKIKVAGDERYTDEPEKVSPWADIADAMQYLLLGGGEGRVDPPATGAAEVKWPANGAAITPQPSKESERRRHSGPVFDPRNGSVFAER